MLRQLCNDASDSVLVKNNGVTWKCDATSFLSDSIVCNENRIASVIAELSGVLTLTLGVNVP